MEREKEKFKYMDILKDIHEEAGVIKYKGKAIELTKHASKEIDFLGFNAIQIINILENGFDCQRSKRLPGIKEKCVIKGDKVIKVVATEKFYSTINQETILIIHIGKFSLRKRK